MNPLGSSQGAIPFLNTYRVSILTNSDIRYEGTLYQVNPDKKNIVLTNVISFGTEGRSKTNEIMGSNVVHDSIVFEGKDIKDLNVIENSPAPTEPVNDNINNNNSKEVQNKESIPSSNKIQKPEDEKNSVATYNNDVHESGKDEAKKNLNERKEERKNENEFDFQEMNEKFHKLTILESKNAEKGFGKYDKQSFFDNISNSTTEKTRETKEERQHQNQIDKETFGSDLMQIRKGQRYKGNNYNSYKTHQSYGKKNSYRNNNYSGYGYRHHDDSNSSYGYRNYEDSNRHYNNDYGSSTARGGYGRGGVRGGYNNQSGYSSNPQTKYSRVYEEKKTKEGD